MMGHAYEWHSEWVIPQGINNLDSEGGRRPTNQMYRCRHCACETMVASAFTPEEINDLEYPKKPFEFSVNVCRKHP